MATIIKRGPYQFQAQIRRKGYPGQTRTFETKKAAQQWVTSIEAEMDGGVFVDRSVLTGITLEQILERYGREITRKKRGADVEMTRIRALMRHPLAARLLGTLTGADFARYCDERLETCANETVRRELVIFSAVFSTVSDLWKLPIGNPLASVKWPPKGEHRERRLRADERTRLLEAAAQSRAETLQFCIILAEETGMRAGEIVGLHWHEIDLDEHMIFLARTRTKNGCKRKVPLSERAEAAIRALPCESDTGRVVSFYDSRGLGAAFRRACERAGIVDVRFHDLRHEAASRLAPRMPATTLAKIMGWKTLQMAMRYYAPTAEELVKAVRAAA
jgi:integrase